MLENEEGSSVIYEKWIQSIAPELKDSSIVSYSGVNLDDTNQRDSLLFPLLRYNMHVIDFWLSNVVFQHEAKTFEQKVLFIYFFYVLKLIILKFTSIFLAHVFGMGFVQ